MATTILKNATVLDTEAATLLPDRFVVIEDGVIREVDTAPPRLDGARTIDVRGATLMPGMIDAHIHATAYTADFGLTLAPYGAKSSRLA